MMLMMQKYRQLFLGALVVAALCTPIADVYAQTYGRPLATTYPAAQPGCDGSVVEPAMSSAGAYSYTQEYSTTYAMIHEPTTFFGCLQGLLNKAAGLLNMFNGIGFPSIAQILETLAADAVKSLIQQLENAACSDLDKLGNQVLAGTGPAANLLSYMNGGNGVNN